MSSLDHFAARINAWEREHGRVNHAARARYHSAHTPQLAGGFWPFTAWDSGEGDGDGKEEDTSPQRSIDDMNKAITDLYSSQHDIQVATFKRNNIDDMNKAIKVLQSDQHDISLATFKRNNIDDMNKAIKKLQSDQHYISLATFKRNNIDDMNKAIEVLESRQKGLINEVPKDLKDELASINRRLAALEEKP